MSIIQIAHNAVTAKLVNPPDDVRLLVNDVLSYKVAGCEHMGAFKMGNWDGRSSFYEYTAGTFPRGFVGLVQSAITKAGHRVQLVRKPFPAPLGDAKPVVDDFGEDPRYDYQNEVVDKLERHGQIIAQVATGGGKSRIAKKAAARINRPTLFLTTRGVLMYQMAKGFETLDKQVSILGDGTMKVSKEITCGMVQTIMSWLDKTSVKAEVDAQVSRMVNAEEKEIDELKAKMKKAGIGIIEITAAVKKRRAQQEKERPTEKEVLEKAKFKAGRQAKRNEKMIEVLSRFEFVILEEAHEASGNSYFDILKHCKNAHYRLALTGTPFMKDDEEANMRLMASSGHIAIKVTEEMLIDRGILAKPYFKFVTLKNKHPKLFKSTPWQRAYELGVVENDFRNRHIVAECLRAMRYGLSIMALVQHKKHGKDLQVMMTAAGIRCEYIFGEDDQVAREVAINKLKKGEVDVLIGSTILDVGVDVPAVGMVVLAGGGKAQVALRQRIGRGLRAKSTGPNVAFILDFADGFNNHLTGHYRQRRAIIEGIKGFGENIVDDFDFAGLGLSKVVQ